MRYGASVLLCIVLGACAQLRPPAPPPSFLFEDESFHAPEERFRGDDIFALSPAMRDFLSNRLGLHARSMRMASLRTNQASEALVDALYKKGELKLEYDVAKTRNASEAFEARAGNCLSLVIMTAALAKELDLVVEYHSAKVEEVWSRDGDLLLGSGHVNVTLSYRRVIGTYGRSLYGKDSLQVDFLPPEEIRGLPLQVIPEDTVVAMYMNNRAVEALVRGELDDAYGWARAAIRRSPGFMNTYNTLGVVYLRHGNLEQAARVLRYELGREPDSATIISNLADALERKGDRQEAGALRVRLARIDPTPPYHFFNLGMEAMQRNDYETARKMFAKEVARADYNQQFHYWLAVAYYKLGQIDRAQRQILLAIERTQTRSDHDLYSAKLAWLQAHGGAPKPAAAEH